MNANEQTGAMNGECPSPETISAWVDGCFSTRDPESVHIQNCEKCQRVANTYRRMDDHLLRYLQGVRPPLSPEESAARIHLKLSRLSHPPKRMRRPIDTLLRIGALAAVVALAAVAGYEINSYYNRTNSKDVQPVVATTVKTDDPKVGDLVNYLPSATTTSTGGTVSMDNINMVSATFGHSPDTASSLPTQVLATIDDSVRQVWTVSDREAAEKLLSMARKSVQVDNPKFDERGVLSFSTKTTCRKLVNLVRAIAEAGAELTTPVQPQPEQCKFTNQPDAMIDYTVEIHYGTAQKKN